jgi:hypothetical protein
MPNTQTQEQRKLKAVTEADAKSVDGQSGRSNNKTNRSGKDAASHTKAHSGNGAGGGKKQQRHH